ncbi:O-antigen ligase family protein [Patescibacteria group bacterium]|nr:O-antigen ligase family protein [Patescibacteria group bacterium]
MFGQFFKKTLLFVILAELFSLLAFLVLQFMPFAFWILVGLFFIICLWKIEYGLYLLLAELFIGSKGYLFFYEVGGVLVSIRIALFLVFMAVWLSKTLIATDFIRIATDHGFKLTKFHIFNKRIIPAKGWSASGGTYYLLLITFIVIGLANGLLRTSPFNDVFFDFNAWVYFALFIPFLDIIRSQKVINNIIQIFIAAITWIAVKTIVVFYLFGHQFFNITPFYKWLRDSGVGEITLMAGNFYRVFFQSQIFIIIGAMLLVGLLIYNVRTNKRNLLLYYQPEADQPLGGFITLLLFTSIIISFARSFWVGWIAGLGLLFLYLILKEKFSWPMILKTVGAFLVFLIISSGIIFGIMKLPPKTSNNASFASLVEKRVSTIEAAGSSRINLLKPLLQENLKHPILGAGFGATVTYQSNDPRIRTELNPEGWYTTYAFEWGYLDIWLKIGIIGLAVYLLFILMIMKQGLKKFKGIENNGLNKGVCLGLLAGMAVLLVINIFSPYLNHPLGIGYILLCGAIFTSLKSKVDYSGE